MPGTLQAFFAHSVAAGAEEVLAAVQRLPEDKQSWSPEGKARTALNMLAEVALLNGQTADLIENRAWPADYNFDGYFAELRALAEDRDKAIALLHETTPKLAAAILAVPDETLEQAVQMRWGPMTLTQLVSYPYWNMKYHTGQINYIASMLGIAF